MEPEQALGDPDASSQQGSTKRPRSPEASDDRALKKSAVEAVDHASTKLVSAEGASWHESKYLVGGERAADVIVTLLSKASPKQAIASFQQENGISDAAKPLQNISIVLPLLDLLQVPRADVHISLLSLLRTKFLELLPKNKDKLEQLLERTFPYISFEELRPIPVAIMQQMSKIPTSFLKQLAQSRELYRSCDVEIQRQVWHIDEPLFRQEVFPLINEYLQHVVHMHATGAPGSDWTRESATQQIGSKRASDAGLPTAEARTRRDKVGPLQALVRLLGTSVVLYRMLLHALRTLFLSTGTLAFCTLRYELHLALHDHGCEELFENDRCDRFLLLLDALFRERKLPDVRRLRELLHELDSLADAPGGLALADAALLCADAHVHAQLLRFSHGVLQEVVDRQAIPKDDEALRSLAALLMLAQCGREGQLKLAAMPKASKDLMGTFYPLLASHLLEARIYDMDKAENDPPALEPLKVALLSSAEPVARLLVLHHIAQRVDDDDIATAQQLVAMATQSPDVCTAVLNERSFVQSVVSSAIRTKSAEMRLVLVEPLLLKHCDGNAFIQTQLVRFISAAGRHLSNERLVSLLQDLVAASSKLPARTSDPADIALKDKLNAMYQSLAERLVSRFAAAQPASLSFLHDFVKAQGVATSVPK